MSFAAVCERFL